MALTHHGAPWRLLPMAILAALLSPYVVSAQPGVTEKAVGTQLGRLSAISGEWPFVDVFRTSEGWVSGIIGANPDQTGGPLNLDPNGWVASLNTSPDQLAKTWMFNTGVAGQAPGGVYTVLYDGEGRITYGGSGHLLNDGNGIDLIQVNPSSTEPLELAILQTNPTNHIRNIRVIMPGGVCSDDPFRACQMDSDCSAPATCDLFVDNLDHQIFHPSFLNNLRRYKIIRFADWFLVNDTDVSEIADYPQLDDAFWSAVPIDRMAQLMNLLDADMWITIPHAASNAFVSAVIDRLSLLLSTDTRLWVELSNEAWNGDFPQHLALAVRGCQEFTDLQTGCDTDTTPTNGVYCEGYPAMANADCQTAQRRYYSQRSTEVWQSFTDAFGASRVVRVLGSQTANTALHDELLGYQNTHLMTDVLGTASFFGYSLGNDPVVSGWTPEQLFDNLSTQEIPETLTRLTTDINHLAATYPDVQVVIYEGGQALAGRDGWEYDPPMIALFDAANRDPRMYGMYRQHLDAWLSLASPLYLHFFSAGGWNMFGRWGALEYQDQPHMESPKYRALLETIEVIDGNLFFRDGFESGDLMGWSSSSP